MTQLCLVIEAQLPIIEPVYRSDTEEQIKPSHTLQKELTCVFVQALYLSVGAVLTEESKIKFDKTIKELSGMPGILEGDGSSVPCGESISSFKNTIKVFNKLKDEKFIKNQKLI